MTEVIDPGWRTYAPLWKSRGRWIEELDLDPRYKSALRREVRRLMLLVIDGKWFDKDRTPIPPDELAKYRHDLDLWEDPAAVLVLVEHGYVGGIGPKGRGTVLKAIQERIGA